MGISPDFIPCMPLSSALPGSDGNGGIPGLLGAGAIGSASLERTLTGRSPKNWIRGFSLSVSSEL